MVRRYDIVVVGGGHAGCEAALAAVRMGAQVLLLTMDEDKIAQMSCNPAVGGIAKGHLVKEIDALGGEMGRNTDRAGIQFRMLNTSKGPAVRALRAQCDKKLYRQAMQQTLRSQVGIDIRRGTVKRVVTRGGAITGVGWRLPWSLGRPGCEVGPSAWWRSCSPAGCSARAANPRSCAQRSRSPRRARPLGVQRLPDVAERLRQNTSLTACVTWDSKWDA